jgi:hypothetical protein
LACIHRRIWKVTVFLFSLSLILNDVIIFHTALTSHHAGLRLLSMKPSNVLEK